MIFSSITFLFYFFPALLLIYFLVPGFLKNGVLLIASLLFYAWGEPVYVLLMILSIIVNFCFGKLFEEAKLYGINSRLLKAHLFIAVSFNIFVLFYFKYAGWVISLANDMLGTDITVRDLSLPIGISFYTFQALSYVLDVYSGKTKAQKSLIDFSLYITMFPQLIAGPIVRYTDIEKQLHDRSCTLTGFGTGAQLFTRGLVKKVLLANTLGAVFTDISSMGNLSAASAWLGAVCYSLQLYFDFSGYSDMAIGLGKMFGFTFPKNFDHPYTSGSVTEFWRRWHISLSSWFREYVYIPLGGNRCSTSRHIRNLFIVWALTGLWHGASTNFLIWGLYYFFWLILEKYVLKSFLDKHPLLGHIYTILIFVVGWVIFAFTDMGQLITYLLAMCGRNGFADSTFMYYLRENLSFLILSIICCTRICRSIINHLCIHAKSSCMIIYICAFLLCIAYLVYDSYNPFLYFRF